MVGIYFVILIFLQCIFTSVIVLRNTSDKFPVETLADTHNFTKVRIAHSNVDGLLNDDTPRVLEQPNFLREPRYNNKSDAISNEPINKKLRNNKLLRTNETSQLYNITANIEKSLSAPYTELPHDTKPDFGDVRSNIVSVLVPLAVNRSNAVLSVLEEIHKDEQDLPNYNPKLIRTSQSYKPTYAPQGAMENGNADTHLLRVNPSGFKFRSYNEEQNAMDAGLRSSVQDFIPNLDLRPDYPDSKYRQSISLNYILITCCSLILLLVCAWKPLCYRVCATTMYGWRLIRGEMERKLSYRPLIS